MNHVHPLSLFAYCPRCGSTDCASPTLKLFTCHACNFQYFQNAAAAVIALILNADNQVLFTRRENEPARGKLGLPGGFVDPLETAEEAVKREVREETGLEVQTTTFLATFPNIYEYKSVTYYTIDLVYLCTVTDLNALRNLDEVTETLFLSPADINPEEIGFESARNAIQAFLNRPADL